MASKLTPKLALHAQAMVAGVETKKRKRAGGPRDRARKGCATCRIRHVKCDEERPACGKCTGTGRTCDGYVAPSTPGAGAFCTANGTSLPFLAVASYSIPFKVPGSQKERQLIHYFCVKGATDLSGSLDPNFWSRTVLQSSHEEAVVRQSLVALSAIHLQYVSGKLSEASTDRPESNSMEPLALYSKALRQVQKYLVAKDKPSHQVVLTCCALFCCFESTRGDHEAATKHLDGGLAILQTIFPGTTAGSSDGTTPISRVSRPLHLPGDILIAKSEMEDMSSLLKLFARLDLQATVFDDDRIPKLDLATWPTAFNTLVEAQWALDQLQNNFFRFLITHSAEHKFSSIDCLPLSIVQGKEQLQIVFLAWERQFATLTSCLRLKNSLATSENSNKSHGFSAEELFISTLHLSYHISSMLLRSAFPEDPSVFCTIPNPDAEQLLVIATHIASTVQCTDSRTYSSAQGIIAPLFPLAMKCSDVSVRQRALALLESIRGRREGLYDAGVVADICNKIAELKRITSEDEKLGLTSDCEHEDVALEWAAPAITDSRGGIAEYARLLAIDTRA